MRRRNILSCSILLFALTSLIFAGCGSEDSPTEPDDGGGPEGPFIWYVDHDAMGTGDGKSWDNAFTHPADAMVAASADDQIWIAYGTYYGPGDKSVPVVAFKAGVMVYGGFGGTETDLSQRDMADRATFDGGDTLYHVVTGADDALLHGIVVRNGNANSTTSVPEMSGGGIYCLNAKMRISNCVIDYNEGYIGGGIYAENDTIVIDSCTISHNHANDVERDRVGGGINIVRAYTVIERCIITNNISARDGGGLLIYNAMAMLNNCDISDNSLNGPYSNGGGLHMMNDQTSAIVSELISCRFARNTGGYGGAVSLNNSSPYFSDCEFEDNNATMTGAALNAVTSSYLMEHCILADNDVTAVYNFHPQGGTVPRIFNCLFDGNGDTDNHGGAIVNNAVDTEIECCTLARNTAGNGGGIYSSGTCSPVVKNCILWFNTAAAGDAQIHDTGGANTIVTYTDINQDGYDGAGLFNIRSAPLFETGPRGDYYLRQIAAGQGSNSPCIDIGSDTATSYGLNILTTRTDSAVDAGQVDLGFHYEPDN